ncbi:MAG: hypothetical protein AAGF28_03115 [Pseudomonadota bacterium]
MEKPIDEWKKRLKGLGSEELTSVWEEKSSKELSWLEEINFHFAAAERMKQLGHMAIDLEDEARKRLCRQANYIVERLQEHLQDDEDRREKLNAIAAKSDAYYEKFGSKTARYYMFEQGVIDEFGDKTGKAVAAE